ncbi:hypothetical protein [Streptomyces sp. NPDC096311]|uniref:hypothetical protein n=1 Tax=Streptomyces sp. NPDC096311 TaxID=3366083 RepID=UPI0038158C2E
MADSTITVTHDVTVDFGCIELTGVLVHDDELRVLELENAEDRTSGPTRGRVAGHPGITPEVWSGEWPVTQRRTRV